MAGVDHVADGPGQGPQRLARLALTIAATLVAVNIWTGAPLLAVWVGSRFAPSNGPSMTAIVIVLATLSVLVFLLAFLLTRLNAAYDRLTGRDPGVRRTTPWLRSMGAERVQLARRRTQLSPIERTVAVTVVFAVLAFEVWFFFFARYSIPGA
jgi:hypothetical protein